MIELISSVVSNQAQAFVTGGKSENGFSHEEESSSPERRLDVILTLGPPTSHLLPDSNPRPCRPLGGSFTLSRVPTRDLAMRRVKSPIMIGIRLDT